MSAGPLAGVRVVEIAGIGPGPFAAMVLSDLGAEVLRIDRPAEVASGGPPSLPFDVLARGRRRAGVDLKKPGGIDVVLRLVARADALVEGFRPGVMERLGLGPDVCLGRNPRLVYGRMTGWGQEGPLARAAGHDIDYIALSGVLAHVGRAGQAPTPPLNLVGDFGGGGMLLAVGILAALVERGRSGRGQVVDAAMVDGSALLLGALYGAHQTGFWSDERGANLLDGGAPFYDAYETADGRWIAVGALEPQFYAELVRRLGLEGEDLPPQMDRAGWPILRKRFAEVFRTRTRDAWCEALEGTDACFAPVLDMGEAHAHPHLRARGTYVDVGGARHPAPAPRFDRTPTASPEAPAAPGAHTRGALADWGFGEEEVDRLLAAGAIV